MTSPSIAVASSIRSLCRQTRRPANQSHLWLLLISSGLMSSGLLAGMGSVASAELVPASASSLNSPPWDGQAICGDPTLTSPDACITTVSCLELQRDACAPDGMNAPDGMKLSAIAEPEVISLLPSYSVASPSPQPSTPVAIATPDGRAIDLKPEVIENSPLLQRWLQEIPDITSEITNSPSFRTRLRLGYSQFPSSSQSSGINLGLEDVFLGRSGLTVSGDYYSTLNGQRQGWGADLHYYMRPLGSYINIAPVVGYRRLDTTLYSTDGLNLGLRLVVVLSRGGGADFSLTQTWLAPGSDREIGILNFSAGYALTSTLRLSADVQQQNARQRQDSRAAIVLEWLL